jgi:hypothetical protein
VPDDPTPKTLHPLATLSVRTGATLPAFHRQTSNSDAGSAGRTLACRVHVPNVHNILISNYWSLDVKRKKYTLAEFSQHFAVDPKTLMLNLLFRRGLSEPLRL